MLADPLENGDLVLNNVIKTFQSQSPTMIGWLLALLSIALYTPALFGGFIYDDHLQIEQNAWLTSIDSLPHFFLHSTAYFQHIDHAGPANYYPLESK